MKKMTIAAVALSLGAVTQPVYAQSLALFSLLKHQAF